MDSVPVLENPALMTWTFRLGSAGTDGAPPIFLRFTSGPKTNELNYVGFGQVEEEGCGAELRMAMSTYMRGTAEQVPIRAAESPKSKELSTVEYLYTCCHYAEDSIGMLVYLKNSTQYGLFSFLQRRDQVRSISILFALSIFFPLECPAHHLPWFSS